MKNIYKQAVDRVEISDDFEQRLLARLNDEAEAAEKRQPRRRLRVRPAVCLALAAVLTASALVVLPGIFSPKKNAADEFAAENTADTSGTVRFAPASSYEPVYQLLSEGSQDCEYDSGEAVGGTNGVTAGNGESSASGAGAGTAEGAAALTAGDFTYSFSGNVLSVCDKNGETVFTDSAVIADSAGEISACALLINDNILAAVAESGGSDTALRTAAVLYDISGKTFIKTELLGQDGGYRGAFIDDGALILFSYYRPISPDAADIAAFVPRFYRSGEAVVALPQEIYIGAEIADGYAVASRCDMAAPSVCTRAVFLTGSDPGDIEADIMAVLNGAE